MSRFALADVIGDLRKELETAIVQGAEESLRFETGVIEVELSVEVEAKGEAGVKFWVVNVGASGARTSSNTVKIPLKPVTRDGRPVLTGGTNLPT